MRYLIVLIWSFLLGQVVGYIGGALNQMDYNFMQTTIISLIVGVILIILSFVAVPSKKEKNMIEHTSN